MTVAIGYRRTTQLWDMTHFVSSHELYALALDELSSYNRAFINIFARIYMYIFLYQFFLDILITVLVISITI